MTPSGSTEAWATLFRVDVAGARLGEAYPAQVVRVTIAGSDSAIEEWEMSQNSGAGIQTGGVHHARLTVADPARSREFYAGLLGFDVLMDFPDGFLLKNGSMLLGIRTAPDASKAAAGDRFDPNRVGLDHLSLIVGSHADLDTAVELCKARDVTCGEIVDFGPTFGFFVLMLEDPDGIQIELVANYA